MAPRPVSADEIEECRTEIHRMIADLDERIDSIEQMNALIHKIYDTSHATNERVNAFMISFSAYEAKASELFKAFPSGDALGHRRAHEAWILKEQRKAEFWKTMQQEAAKYGLIGALGAIATMLWIAFKIKITS